MQPIVTAASINFHGGLRNLVASARYWAPNHDVVIYNLKDSNDTTIMKEIRSWSAVIALEWLNSVPDHYSYADWEHLRRKTQRYTTNLEKVWHDFYGWMQILP